MIIILREDWTYLKILTSPMLPSISRSYYHSYSKSLSQIMIVGAHHGVGVKIHTLRSMASTINTSRNESFFGFSAAISVAPWRSVAAPLEPETTPCSRRLHPNGCRQHPDGHRWHPDTQQQHPDERWHSVALSRARLGRIVTRSNNTPTFASTRQRSDLVCHTWPSWIQYGS
jgi:hypothetical protein